MKKNHQHEVLSITVPFTESAAWPLPPPCQNLQTSSHSHAQPALLQGSPCSSLTDHLPSKQLLWTHCFNPSGRHRMSHVSSILWGGNLSCRTLIPRNVYVLITVTWPKSHFGLQARSYSNKATLEDCCWPQTVTHVKTVFKLAFGQTHICKASSHPNAPIPEAQQKKKIEKKEKPASYFDGICMFCEIAVRTLVSYSG